MQSPQGIPTPPRDGIQVSPIETNPRMLKDGFTRYRLDGSLDDLVLTTLGLLEPGLFHISVGRAIELSNESPEELDLVFSGQRLDLLGEVSDTGGHVHLEQQPSLGGG